MADWRSEGYLQDHFRRHGRRLKLRTVAAYEASARETIEAGTYFEYRDLDTNTPRVGYYARATRRLTVLSYDESVILTHYRCSEQYVTETLPGSTYA